MLKHLQQVGRSLRKEPAPQPKVVEFRAPPPPPDFRNLTERNLDTTTGMLKSLDDAERKLEAEIAERQERLVHIRRSQRAFNAAKEILDETSTDVKPSPKNRVVFASSGLSIGEPRYDSISTVKENTHDKKATA